MFFRHALEQRQQPMLSFSFIVSLEKNHFFFMGSDPESCSLFTHYRRKCRFSPVDINSLYNMNSSNQHRRGMQNLTITINTYVVFHPDHDVDPLMTLGFRCSIAIPVILLSTLSLQRYRGRLKTRFKCCGQQLI